MSEQDREWLFAHDPALILPHLATVRRCSARWPGRIQLSRASVAPFMITVHPSRQLLRVRALEARHPFTFVRCCALTAEGVGDVVSWLEGQLDRLS